MWGGAGWGWGVVSHRGRCGPPWAPGSALRSAQPDHPQMQGPVLHMCACPSIGHRGRNHQSKHRPSRSTGGPLPGGPEAELGLFLLLWRQCDPEDRVLRCITL